LGAAEMVGKQTMIDEDRTIQLFGYTSSELKPKSNRPVVCVCEGCGKYRILKKNMYRELCKQCRLNTPETKLRLSIANKNRLPCTDKTRKKLSESLKNRPPRSQEWCDNISKAKKDKPTKLKGYERSFEERKKLSATNQGIEYDEWNGFAHEQKYCRKFNDELKLKIRTQYNFECVVCDMTEDESVSVYKEVLSIHHVDGDKEQGCNGHEINMIPLCKKCHGRSHHEPMKSRINYLINNGIVV
jgi:hypothetical protein